MLFVVFGIMVSRVWCKELEGECGRVDGGGGCRSVGCDV